MMKGDKVRIILKANGYNYNGTVLEITDKEITILDRLNDEVTISKDAIAITEVKR